MKNECMIKVEPPMSTVKFKSFLIEDILGFKDKPVETSNCADSLTESKKCLDNIINKIISSSTHQLINTSTNNIVRPWDIGATLNTTFLFNGLPNSLLFDHVDKNRLKQSTVRPRSADDDTSQSERSASSDSTIVSNSNSNLNTQNSPLECLYELTNKTLEHINKDTSMNGSSDHLNIFSNRPPPKKKRKSRTAFTNTQIFELERKFIQQRYLSPADRDDLASRLGLTGPQVITWFQNRRAKDKREKEETKNDLKTIYPFPEINIYDNIQDLSMLKVPDIRASLHFHRDHLDMEK